jgi:hypothetical protein
VNRENLLRQAKLGRIATHRAIAEARRAATQAKQAEALRKWNPSDLPKWLDENFYRREVLPRLSELTVRGIRIAIGGLTLMQLLLDLAKGSRIRGIGWGLLDSPESQANYLPQSTSTQVSDSHD